MSTKATRWGCEHEEVARDKFIEEISKMHVNFKVSECGFFFINPDVPYLGASPDGLVWCDCCGEGFLEINVPFVKSTILYQTLKVITSFVYRKMMMAA